MIRNLTAVELNCPEEYILIEDHMVEARVDNGAQGTVIGRESGIYQVAFAEGRIVLTLPESSLTVVRG